MKGTRVSSRYAKSLLGIAKEQGELEQAYSDMKLISETCENNKELTLLLKTPIVKADKKIQVLDALFSNHIGKLSMRFVQTIARKGRERFLYTIAVEFQNQYKVEKNIVTAVVTSATGLDEKLRKKVLELVKNSVASEVELIENQDKDLIGGFIVRLGDKQVDASIHRKLNDLKKSLSEQFVSDN